MKYVFLLGRALFALVFILLPIKYFTGSLTVDSPTMSLPFQGSWLALGAIIAFIGGFSILLGFYSRFGALLLLLFLVPSTLYMHQFWVEGTDFAQTMHNFCFWKNVALAGVLLMFTYTGSGPFSLRCEKKW